MIGIPPAHHLHLLAVRDIKQTLSLNDSIAAVNESAVQHSAQHTPGKGLQLRQLALQGQSLVPTPSPPLPVHTGSARVTVSSCGPGERELQLTH